MTSLTIKTNTAVRQAHGAVASVGQAGQLSASYPTSCGSISAGFISLLQGWFSGTR